MHIEGLADINYVMSLLTGSTEDYRLLLYCMHACVLVLKNIITCIFHWFWDIQDTLLIHMNIY